MTDLLAERFAALADTTDDSDWLDVERRARRRRQLVTPLAALAAALAVVATAVAAGGGWLFTSHERAVTAEETVTLAGQRWHVSITTRRGGPCIRFAGPSGSVTSACDRSRSKLLGPPFGARHLDVAGGQIWAGATIGFARRIAITDAAGRVHATQTVAAPPGTKTPFRYWVIALDSTTAQSLTAYGPHGRAVTKRLR